MRKILAAALALGAATAADAAVAILDSVTPVAEGFRFDYRLTLGPDEGLRAGDSLVIYDFAGYVEGSAFSPDNTTATVEFTSLPFITPGETDDPGIVNLVWTYTGEDFRTSGGPYEPIIATGFGAISRFGLRARDAFTSETTKNNPPGTAGTPLVQGGYVEVPAVPEPAQWALMIAGFGLVGAAARRRRTTVSATYA